MNRRKRERPPWSRPWAVILLAGLVLLLIGCASCYLIYQVAQRDARNAQGGSDASLRVAYSPDKQALFEELVKRFNASRPKSPTGKRIVVVAKPVEPEAMLSATLEGQFDALCPDSSIWLTQLDLDWKAQRQSEASVVGETTRFAVSPVVIAMWEDAARSWAIQARRLGGWICSKRRARTPTLAGVIPLPRRPADYWRLWRRSMPERERHAA